MDMTTAELSPANDADILFPPEDDRLPPEAHNPAFRIDSRDQAEWFLRKLKLIRAEQEWVAANSKKIIKDLDDDYAKLMNRFGDDLRGWALEEIAKQRDKHIELLNGTIRFRSTPESISLAPKSPEYDAWVRENAPEAVKVETKTVETIGVTKVKEALLKKCEVNDRNWFVDTVTGEELDFAGIVPAFEKMTIE